MTKLDFLTDQWRELTGDQVEVVREAIKAFAVRLSPNTTPAHFFGCTIIQHTDDDGVMHVYGTGIEYPAAYLEKLLPRLNLELIDGEPVVDGLNRLTGRDGGQ